MTDERELFGRLRRLRREVPRADEPPQDARGREAGERMEPPAPAPGLPAAVRARLARRERALVRGASDGPADAPRGGARRLGAPAELALRTNARGAFLVRERRFALAHRHGGWTLGEVDAARAADVAWLAGDPALGALDWRAATWLDVETTGLAGGAGTIAFLVALGSFEEDVFVLRQAFLRGPEDEAACLADVALRVARGGALVSFFGKSFDRHRLEDKMRVHGIAAPFAGRAHLDLYHPLRRLYGAALPDARLATLERALCGVARADDLSGRFAPEAWLDFLAARAHRLEDVFRHNEDDVLSLVVLAAHLGRALLEQRAGGGALGGPAAARAEAVGRRLLAQRRRGEALVWIERALERSTPEEARSGRGRALRCAQAELWLAAGRAEEALERLEALAAEVEDACAVRALLALAAHHERAGADPFGAQRAFERARRSATRLGLVHGTLAKDLERRAERLARAVAARSAAHQG